MEQRKALQQYLSFEVLSHTINHDTVRVATALHLSEGHVRKYKQPPSTEANPDFSGERNPLDRLAIIIQSIELIDKERAYKPIAWLNARFGFAPPVKIPSFDIKDQDLITAVLKWSSEFGETSALIEAACHKGNTERRALLKDIFRELLEDYQAGLSLLSKLEALDR